MESNRLKSNDNNNHIKYKGVNMPIKRQRLLDHKKKQDTNRYCLPNTHTGWKQMDEKDIPSNSEL